MSGAQLKVAVVSLVIAVAVLSMLGYSEGGILYAVIYPTAVIGVTLILNILFMALE